MITTQRDEHVTRSPATDESGLSHPTLPSSTCLSMAPWRQCLLHSEKLHSRENSHYHASGTYTLSSPLFFIAENTKSSKASKEGIYFGPKQKGVGDAVGRDS